MVQKASKKALNGCLTPIRIGNKIYGFQLLRVLSFLSHRVAASGVSFTEAGFMKSLRIQEVSIGRLHEKACIDSRIRKKSNTLNTPRLNLAVSRQQRSIASLKMKPVFCGLEHSTVSVSTILSRKDLGQLRLPEKAYP